MVVCFCPACGKKVFIKGVSDGEYPVSFKHCGHLIDINKEPVKRKKIGKASRFL